MFCNNFYSSSTFAFISDLFFFCSSFVDFCRRMILIEKVSRVIRKARTNGFFFLYRQRVRMFYNNFYPSSFVFLSVLFSSALCSLSFIVGWFLLFLVKSFSWLVWASRDNFFSFSILVFPFLFSSASLSFSRGWQLDGNIFHLLSPVFHSYNFVNMILFLSREGEQVFLYRKIKLLFVK